MQGTDNAGGDLSGGDLAGGDLAESAELETFHPAVAEWFRRRYPGGPTQAQAEGWAAIASGVDTLIAAPTGSGKTLAAFLVAIDRCYRAAVSGDGRRGTDVVYVSPLRALTVDVSENLRKPLAEIVEVAIELGLEPPNVKVAVRNGDTPPAERSAMVRNRPEIVVTTPESLYLLLTSARGREMLRTVRTVIIDEIHALARDKRGVHLALSLERLDRLVRSSPQLPDEVPGKERPADEAEQPITRNRPVRIGLSATQRPIATIARLLIGAGPDRTLPDGEPRCAIVDVGHRRPLDVAIELPNDELGAVSTLEQMDSVLERIAAHIECHRTTLVFVNTRRMAERVAHQLADRLGEDCVQAHHGSLSMDRRLRVESRLRAGELRAVVATASLELGIDVGPVELVCQLGSPRSIATFLQRVGRAQHHVGGVPVGRLYPLTRDELVECTALLASIRAGDLDAITPPVAPLDILAQQLVAECAASDPEGCSEEELLALARRSAPYSALGAEDFEKVLELVSQGVVTGRGRRGAHLHRDRVNGVLRPRRGARLTAATSGGAIPDVADYRVVLEPEETLVGTVNEDWAIESMAGDVFLLGSATWRIRRIETGTVRVVDAEGASPTVPFWLGEAPARTMELSEAVSGLRRAVETTLAAAAAGAAKADAAGGAGAGAGADTTGRARAIEVVEELAGIDRAVAQQVVSYLATGYAELGALPTTDRFVIERFFDDTGGMQLVVHSPRGARVNRGLGLALRKRFCRTFDFELQAAASDDAVVLSLGPQHSFPLEEVLGFLSPATVRDTLIQAVLPTPMFTSRWRWNLTRSLVSPRYRGTRRVPPAIQRMEADDLMAAVFPALAACQENVSGPIEIPDQPIVRQTLDDCCTEAMDLEGLTDVLARVRSGEVLAHCVDTVIPSVLAEEILNGRPYTFLDDAPLEERRTRAVTTRRGLPVDAQDLAELDPGVVARVVDQAAPELRNAEELHDLLCSLVLAPPTPEWDDWMAVLESSGRAMTVELPSAVRRWVATENRELAAELAEGASFVPDHRLARDAAKAPSSRDEALVAAARGHLEILGPVTLDELAASIGTGTLGELRSAVARLEGDGSVLRCHLAGSDKLPEGESAERFCARHLLARVHAAMRAGSRRSVEPVSAQQFMRFLLAWQHVGPGHRLLGSGGVVEVVEQLQGYEVAVDAWESAILPARVAGYHAALLDEWCARGEVAFGRLGLRVADPVGSPPRRGGSTPSPATPISLFRREDLEWLLAAARDTAMPDPPRVGAALEVVEALRRHGALFVTDLCQLTGRLPGEVAEALWDGMARGLLTADGFQAVRSLLGGRGRQSRSSSFPGRTGPMLRAAGRPAPGLPRPGRNRPRVRPAVSGGRWSLLGDGLEADGTGGILGFDPDELADAIAGQLLARWGVVFRDLVGRESLAIAWRDILWALRRLEARGVALGGRFVAGFTGEQFALPEAGEQLRAVAKRPLDGVAVQLSATDPLNLTGVILPGPRIPAQHARTVILTDGVLEQLSTDPIPRPGALRG